MTVRELIRTLQCMDLDAKVLIADDEQGRLLEADGVDTWRHFQTNKPLGGVIIFGEEHA